MTRNTNIPEPQTGYNDRSGTTTSKITKNVCIEEKAGRYVITDSVTGIIIDNAQGYGFKSEASAFKYAKPKGWVVLTEGINSQTNALF